MIPMTEQRESATTARDVGSAGGAPTDAVSAGAEPAGLAGRRATLQDVAKAAGVSVSAVSKVVRGAYGVSPQMRSRVTAAIDDLGYRPNAGARGMRGRSYTVGVVLVDLTSPFQPEVAKGISDELEDTPYQDVIVTGGATPEHQKRSIEALLDRQVDGLVLVAPWLDVAWIEKVAETVPVVAVALHGPASNFDTVVHDHRVGTQLVVDYLADAGHRRIVHTSMPPADVGEGFMLSHTATRHAFEQAMRRRRLEPDVIETWYDEEGGYRATMQAFDGAEPPTAIFAGADIAALGVLRATEELDLRVPEDLTVVGYDNIYMSTINRISLTTVDQSGQLTGRASTRLLLERIDGGRTTPKQYVLAPRLIPRGTSGPPPGPVRL
jgi:LacI family transcriptional regulator